MKPSKITATVVFDYTELLTKIKGEIRDYGDGEVTASARVRYDGETWLCEVDVNTLGGVTSWSHRNWFRGPVNNTRQVTLADVQGALAPDHMSGLLRGIRAMTALAGGVVTDENP